LAACCHSRRSRGTSPAEFQTPGSEGPDALMEALELFGKKVLPQIRDV
jgi:hypothetical protein